MSGDAARLVLTSPPAKPAKASKSSPRATHKRTMRVVDVYMDEDGQVPAREAATLLWLAGCLAAGGGVVLADVIAWVGGYAS